MGSGLLFGTASAVLVGFAFALVETVGRFDTDFLSAFGALFLVATSYALIVTFAAVLIVGLPIAHLLQKLNRFNGVSLTISGAIGGAIIAASEIVERFSWETVIAFSLAGGLAGFAFWLGYQLKAKPCP